MLSSTTSLSRLSLRRSGVLSLFRNLRHYSDATPEDVKKQASLNQFQKQTENEASKERANPPVFFQSDKPPPEVFKDKTLEQPKREPVLAGYEDVKQSKARTVIVYTLALLSVAFIFSDLIEAVTPANTDYISEEVLEIISKAIEAESDKNIAKAISYYIQALKQLDEEESEHITPCYTSCCVRIAQLYEHEKKFEKAIAIYKEVADSYLNAFTHRDDFKTLQEDKSFDFAILRSLTVAIRYAYLLNEKNNNDARELLMFNIIEAQKRVIEAYPPFMSVLNDINNRNILDIITSELEQSILHLPKSEQEAIIKKNSETPIELPLFTTEQTPENKILGLNVKAWPVFTRVLINAKDLYVNLSVEANDLSSAISNLTNNSIIIQRCFDHPSRLALTLTKLGVALQMTYQTLNKDFPVGKEIEIVQDNSPVKVDLSDPQLKDYVLNTTRAESSRIFTKVLSLCENMKKQEKLIKSNHLGQGVEQWEAMFKPALDRSEMVSSASLGLLNLQNGNTSEALKLLRRAKVLATKLHDDDYITDINDWISKVEN